MFDKLKILKNKLASDAFTRKIFGAVSGAIFVSLIIGRTIELAASRHWTLALILILLTGVVAFWVTSVAASPQMSIAYSIVFFILAVMLAAIFCSGISYLLYHHELAQYEASASITFEVFLNHYLWVVIDMIPAIEVWNTLTVKPSIKATNPAAGAPVLIFRIFVLLYLFAALLRWWEIHTKDASKTGQKGSEGVG